MCEGILARPVNIESMMGMFECRDAEATLPQNRDQPHDQRGLASDTPTGNADHPHGSGAAAAGVKPISRKASQTASSCKAAIKACTALSSCFRRGTAKS